MLAFGSRVVGLELAKMIVDAWLGAQYEGGRHQQRVEAITAIEQQRTNVLAFGSRVVGLELAKMIVDAWLGAQYEGGRHQQRVEAITAIEQQRN